MANPNIVNVTSILGNVAYVTPSTTGVTTSWTYDGTTADTGLNPAVNTMHRVTSIVASNTTGTAANATVAISNNATFGSGTAFPIASSISVPGNASLIITDKTTSFYLTENQSLAVTSGTANALTFTATFEIITS